MGKLADIKNKATDSSVSGFLDGITDDQKRLDSYTILAMMEKATKQKPKMWGNATIGFGDVVYKSPTSGREVAWFKIGFSPRKANLSLNLIDLKQHAEAMKQLGKHKAGMGCIYINKLADVDLKVLEKMIATAAK